jgi:hypothetical protein
MRERMLQWLEREIEIQDALKDSSFLAGVKSGWNAANSDNPEEELARIRAGFKGYLAPIARARREERAAPAPSQAGEADHG